MSNKCKIGMINFLNGLIPDYHFTSDLFDKYYGLPAELNQMLRRGDLDISPVSSMEYLLNSEQYHILPGLCISAFKEVLSVGVFSHLQPHEWHQKKIYLSGASLTSKYLLKVICKKYLNVSPIFIEQDIKIANQESFSKVVEDYDAILLIGDRVLEFQNQFDWKFHDLAKLWFEQTDLPFVFALWLVRSDFANEHRQVVSQIHYKQLESIVDGLDHLDEIYQKDSKNLSFVDFCHFLENTMNYQLSPFEFSGLKRFSEDLIELKLLNNFNGFHFFDGNVKQELPCWRQQEV
ncbi:menaquinone biosynthesis protein [bacterium]|nr:menaquinone biosynthesis protein [bacterium]